MFARFKRWQSLHFLDAHALYSAHRAIPGAIPALCRAGIASSCAAFRARFGASTAQGWVVLQAKLLAALCLHAVAAPRLQRLAAQPCGASRVPAGLPAAPSSMDGHPAFFRRFQRRRCPPPITRFQRLLWPLRWTLKIPDARPSRVGKRGFAPTDLFGRLSLSAPGLRPKNQRLPHQAAAWTVACAPTFGAPDRPGRKRPGLSIRPPTAAPPACCPLALASSLRRLARARATGSARLAGLARLQVPPGSLAIQLDYQAECALKLKPHTYDNLICMRLK